MAYSKVIISNCCSVYGGLTIRLPAQTVLADIQEDFTVQCSGRACGQLDVGIWHRLCKYLQAAVYRLPLSTNRSSKSSFILHTVRVTLTKLGVDVLQRDRLPLDCDSSGCASLLPQTPHIGCGDAQINLRTKMTAVTSSQHAAGATPCPPQ